MSTQRIMIGAALAFVAGFMLSYLTRPKERPAPEQFNFAAPITAFQTDGGTDFELTPYRVVIDGEGRWVGPEPRSDSAAIWRVNLCDERVVVYATRR